MNARERLMDAIQNEIDNADFTTEKGQDDSYQHLLDVITEIFRQYPDNTLTLQDIVETVNIIDDLSVPLNKAYSYAIINLFLEYGDETL